MRFKNVYKRLITIGVHEGLSSKEGQIIKVANQVYLMAILSSVFLALLNRFFGHSLLSYINISHCFIFFLGLIFSRFRQHDRGYAFALHGTYLAIFLFSSYLGVEAEVDFYLFSIVVFVVFIYGKTSTAKVWYYLTITMMLYISMHLTRTINFFPGVVLEDRFLEAHRICAFILNIMICTIAPLSYKVEQKKREDFIKASKKKTEILLEKKTRFFAMLNHEIRTPLQGIVGLSALLAEKRFVTADLKEKLQVINFSAKNLKNIVGDILDYSKSEDGRLTFNSEIFNFNDVINGIDNVHAIRIESKGLFFEKHIEESLPSIIRSDPYRINQVVNNLIDNAIKFTQRGIISFSVSFVSVSSKKGELKFIIKDSGIGIPEKDLATVFDAYTQIAPVSTRNFDGTGLGLAICKNIIEGLGGGITLNSEQGVGTEVYFNLPIDVIDKESQLKIDNRSEKCHLRKLSGLKVLLVEDNLINQFVCQEVFNELGVQFFIKNDGFSALDFLKNQSVDFVIMDYHMPGMDGFLTSKKIRENEKVKNQHSIPIILATADTEGANYLKYGKYGINGHIVKPFTKDDLIRTLLSFQEKFKITTDIMNTTTFFNQIDFSGPQINFEFIENLLGNDREAVMNLLDMVLSNVPEAVNEINLFRKADLSHRETQQKLITAVHNLKSNLRNIGASNFALVLQIAEDNIRKDPFDGTLWEAMTVIENNMGSLDVGDYRELM